MKWANDYKQACAFGDCSEPNLDGQIYCADHAGQLDRKAEVADTVEFFNRIAAKTRIICRVCRAANNVRHTVCWKCGREL